ncbi:MAG TPA: hypothetical protein VGV88_03065 [Candidatus Dormibacteraeota bacterium]|nr:hypothetical protein [Candidatus Dormibacteraeota bacterium]
MDERAVFDQFHEALELEPQAGAYERFRAVFISPPAATKRRPVFRLRFSPMTLRIAAAVAVAAIAIALVAGYMATHHSPTGSISAGPDKNVQAYKTMMRTDNLALGSSFSTHCATVSDTGCVAALNHIVSPLQKWISDMDAFKTTPRQFAVIGGQVREHAAAMLSDLNLAIAAVGARDNHGLVTAINAAGPSANWMGRATSAITETQQAKASDYIALVKVDGDALNVCDGCLALAAPSFSCALTDVCVSDVITADDTIGQLEADAILQAAPSQLAGKDQRLQTDLAAADSALLRMLESLLTNDKATFNATQDAYRLAVVAVSSDIFAITG